jgi:acyl-CoA synthetase (AMP-forming)/AMP-acid ligase II
MIIVATASPDVDVMEAGVRVVRYQDWAEDEECLTLDIDIDDLGEDEEAFLHYTSGTTSLPKGVLSSQKSWLWNVNSVASVFGLTPEDRFFWPLPLFHCLGHSLCIIATVAVGASAYLPDADQTPFDSLLDTQAREATIIVGAPATFHELIDAARLSNSMSSLSLPRLRACMYGGSSAPASLSAQVQELFGAPLLNNYGCTEACGAIAINKPGDLYRQHSSATPLPGWEIQLMDPDGNQVNDGEQSEVWIRGPGLMLKYYKDTRPPFTADGWFPTGDIAIRSSSTTGTELTLVGRKKELIVRGGENIQPNELERVLIRHPGVADVVVAGIPHRLLGETPAAFIVKGAADLDLDLSALLAACREALPDYKLPTGK